MKIVIINGSPRKNGSTGQILHQIERNLINIDNDLEIKYFNLSEMDLKFCKGCFNCYKTGSCFIKDDGLEDLHAEIKSCDGVIFGSPTYASNVSGQFKVFMDRIQFVFEQLLFNKACFSIVTYENAEGNKALKIINQLIQLSGGSVSASYLLKLDYNDVVFNDIRINKLKKLSSQFMKKVQSSNPLTIFEKIKRYLVFNVGLKPCVLKDPESYKSIINRWSTIGLIKSTN